MSNHLLSQLDAERTKLIEFVDETLSIAANEERDLVDSETRTLNSTRERIAQIDAQIKPLNDFEQIRASAVVIDKRVTTSPRATNPADLRAYVNDSLGARFIQSEQYRNYTGGNSGRMDFDSLPSEVRAPLSTLSPPGSLLLPQPQKFTSEAPNLLTPLLQAITRVQVSTGTVEVVTYGDPTGAAVVPELGLKPEATLSITTSTIPLEVIAATQFASRQLLQDATQAQQFINSQLTRAVIRKLEENITGVIDAAPIPTLAGASGEELLAQIRRGTAVIQAAGYQPTHLLAHPDALANTDLQILSLGGATAAVIGAGVWGLQTVAVPAFAPDQVYVSDLSAAVQLFERQGVQVFMSDSDVLDDGTSAFRKNILSFICELRAVAAVTVLPASVQLTPFVGP